MKRVVSSVRRKLVLAQKSTSGEVSDARLAAESFVGRDVVSDQLVILKQEEIAAVNCKFAWVYLPRDQTTFRQHTHRHSEKCHRKQDALIE